MKNIHLLPTTQNSRLHCYPKFRGFPPYGLSNKPLPWREGRNIYITSDEEIKKGDWVIIDYTFSGQGLMLVKTTEINLCDVEHGQQLAFSSNGYFHELRFCKKIILTIDQDLISDGVQAIDDEFLEWFINNPSCEFVEVKKGKMKVNDDGCRYGFPDMSLYEIIIPKEEPNCICKTGEPYNNACCKVHGSIPQEEIKQVEVDWSNFPQSTKDAVGYIEPKQSVQEYEQQGLEKYAHEMKQETLEEAKQRVLKANYVTANDGDIFEMGVEWKDEQIPSIINEYLETAFISIEEGYMNPIKWFEEFKKK